jgi:hypothetical protein
LGRPCNPEEGDFRQRYEMIGSRTPHLAAMLRPPPA